MIDAERRHRSDERGMRQRGSRTVTISLPHDEAVWLDEVTDLLTRARLSTSRSSVVREALLRLRDCVEGKAAHEVVLDFVSSQARRSAANAAMGSR